MSRVDTSTFEDMITTQDLTKCYPSDKQRNTNKKNATEHNAYAKGHDKRHTSTPMSSNKKTKK